MKKDLRRVWEEVRELNQSYFPDNYLMPILGGGQTHNPEIMFVFINPTVRNISSDPSWSGPRFPFIGTKQIWRIFHRSGFLSEELLRKIEVSKEWPVELAVELEESLKGRGLYLTNLVKWTGKDGSLPDKKKIDLFLPVLRREIEIVKPASIIAFGLLPFKYLTGEEIRLGSYWEEAVKTQTLSSYPLLEGEGRVIPCYFPVGRGNPKRAIEILRLHPLSGNVALLR